MLTAIKGICRDGKIEPLQSLPKVGVYEVIIAIDLVDRHKPEKSPESIVAKTKGTIRNLDKETVKLIAESEEFCGY